MSVALKQVVIKNEPPLGVSEQVRHKPTCAVTETDLKLEILDLRKRVSIKSKALISFVVTAKQICVFVFAYVNCWFSHEAAQITIYWNSSAVSLYILKFGSKFLTILKRFYRNKIHNLALLPVFFVHLYNFTPK